MTVSVVIPALDEERLVARAVASVRADADVLVVDGGSTDRTREVARAAGARVVDGPRGRGPQLGEGAGRTRGDWIVFLHADTWLEPGWASALALPGEVAGGAFRLAVDSPRPVYRLVEAAVRLRTRLFALPYGDQGMFARRAAYERVGGIAPLPLMEDVDFVRRLRRAGRLAFPRARAVTSPRRWERGGVAAATARNLRVLALYALGRPASRLAELYESGFFGRTGA